MVDWFLLPLAALVDALYIGWMWAAETKRPMIGGLTSASIWRLTLWGVVEVSDNKWNTIPILIGAYLGSYVTIWLKVRKNETN